MCFLTSLTYLIHCFKTISHPNLWLSVEHKPAVMCNQVFIKLNSHLVSNASIYYKINREHAFKDSCLIIKFVLYYKLLLHCSLVISSNQLFLLLLLKNLGMLFHVLLVVFFFFYVQCIRILKHYIDNSTIKKQMMHGLQKKKC